MKCTNCGQELNPGQKFCPNCGQSVQPQVKKTVKSEPPKSASTVKDEWDRAAKSTWDKIKEKPSLQWIIGLFAFIVIVGVVIFMFKPEQLNGSYSHSTNLIVTNVKEKVMFKGNKFTDNQGDEGTYKIDGDQLKLDGKINGKKTKAVATLSKDRKSFDLSGEKFTKDDE
ncbi:zinc ribbon domain-containing protein [Fructilactobacillus hinvesii]|uniref:Zinc ribbon domain-containing protein n=1 Tax=Fructilactobacillus hinvesii TaxID=2940300 RepID=A0ABY5BVQ0_9LACO|nr:zinc ribbon domain-containing protein [Fructilactobacillus hinvesii]USS88056.1 zinc ribbon domain-containing protein [Fructilactobacillus hinvesii]